MVIPALIACLCAAACGSTGTASTYVHPNADLSAYARVAVLPLENLSTDRFAADRVREVLSVELAASGLCQVIEQGEVNRVLRARGIADVKALGADEVAAIGRELDAQGLVTGVVMEYAEQRTGTFTAPTIALSLRLLDVETGIAAWSVSDARSGLGVWTRLFGVGERSSTDVVRDLIRDLVDQLVAAAS